MSAAEMWKVKPDSDQWAVRVGGDQAGTLPTKKARPGLIRVESKSINSESENGAKTTPCLIGRDPRALNAHVQIEFSNIFGEADDAHSLQCTWRISSRVFTCCQRTCYQCWSALCACPVSMAYGIVFGATAVAHVWSLTPAWRFFDTCVIDPLRSFARLHPVLLTTWQYSDNSHDF
ncbi:caveolin-2-like [Dreissena polymorpha]|uniref:caveolin-2-like n=1 Tax=Dreissena polymorpha TaxID=45954 RepID=UPI002264ED12|nr:caveolin-2-like [Dreissena polymorpha]